MKLHFIKLLQDHAHGGTTPTTHPCMTCRLGGVFEVPVVLVSDSVHPAGEESASWEFERVSDMVLQFFLSRTLNSSSVSFSRLKTDLGRSGWDDTMFATTSVVVNCGSTVVEAKNGFVTVANSDEFNLLEAYTSM